MIRCLRCFEEYPDIFNVCPVCGNSVGCLSAPKGWLKPGCRLDGRFIVGTGAGRGGFGVVYKAYDELTGEITAIKELFLPSLVRRSDDGISVEPLSSRSGSQFDLCKKKFMNEAVSAARVRSKTGCAVFDCFEENGTAYIAMEYLGGRTLAGVISGGKCGLKYKTEIMLALIKSVSELHSSGTVHLDIAPDNIIIGEGENGSLVHLIDFGSSFSEGEYGIRNDRVFKAGYSSPELISGIPKGAGGLKAGKLCDIYSLGATAYVLYSGERPPEEKNLKNSMLSASRKLSALMPEKMSDAIMRAMHPEPGKRFSGADDFYVEFEAAAAHAGILKKDNKQIIAGSSLKAPGPGSPFCELKERKKEYIIGDKSLLTGVSIPVPDRLLPGTEIKGRYQIGLECHREGICEVYNVVDPVLRTGVQICEFFPERISRRGNDGIEIIPVDESFYDLRTSFFDNAERLSAFRGMPGGDGITDVFYENNTAYFVRRAGKRLAVSNRKSKNKTDFKETSARLSEVENYLNELWEAGLSHLNILPGSLRMTDGNRISLFSPAVLFWPEQVYRYGNPERGYTPPELYKMKACALNDTGFEVKRSDLYMLGALFFKCISGKEPPDGGFRAECVSRGIEDPLLDYRRYFSREGFAEIYRMMSIDPKKRRMVNNNSI